MAEKVTRDALLSFFIDSCYLLENYRELEHSRNVENVRSETVAEETGISRQGESFARQEMLQEMRAEMGFGNMIL